MTSANGVPPGLPDRLIHPPIDLDPDADVQNRRMDAFRSFRVYARELEVWLHFHSSKSTPKAVMAALGTDMESFLRVATELPESPTLSVASELPR